MASSVPVPTATGTGADEKTYTLESLKEHSSRESLWMLLHDKVYDVTRFMDEHPGGDEVLLEEAGRDATEAFEDVGHSDEARAMLPKMLLGEFKGEFDKSGRWSELARLGS
ncbi:Cytochrome b5 [Saitozyma sp. JCM 24511]|nr:Cytochrome b5 [Saitozyma sp. JCM 24511]